MRANLLTVIATMAALGVGLPAAAQSSQPTDGGAMSVLSADSCLRAYLTFAAPVLVTKDGTVAPIPNPNPKQVWPPFGFQSAPPPADWFKAEFNDSLWLKDRAPIEAGPETQQHSYAAPSNSLVCVRGKFTVEDPAKVRDLKLSIEYVGGVVVYLNGQELTRGHMPPGQIKPDTLAENYPDDLYCEPNGMFVQVIREKLNNPAGFDRRFRKLTDVAVPADRLLKGVNVLAVEIHRSAINEAATQAKRVQPGPAMVGIPGIWAYAGLKDLTLTAAPGSALSPNVTRPRGVQVWNCAPADTVTAFDYGDGGDLQPVVISSPRNGVFSGRLAVSSDQAIKTLKVVVTDLALPGGGKLASSAVQVRCATAGIVGLRAAESRYSALSEAIPAEIPALKAAAPTDYWPVNYLRIKYSPGPRFPVARKNITGGAVTPIWLTVRVPKGAAPGTYEGTVTISATGLEPVAVPLKVIVSAWKMPDPKDFRITNFGQHSPDSLAKAYNVPLWSKRHFELMGKSLSLMAEVNSRQALGELSIDFYGMDGNQESMVRWIKQADGSYTHDFTVFDAYLDMVAKHMGKPSLLRLNCWGELRPGWGGMPEDFEACWKKVNEGRKVSLLDPVTKQIQPIDQPVPGTQESLEFWKPVLDEVRKKVEARGWFDVTAMGHNSYNSPPHPTVVGMFKKIWPDGAWSFTAHNGLLGASWRAADKATTMPARHADCVWTRGPLAARGYRALLKPRPGTWCYTFRTDVSDASDLFIVRDIIEEEIMSGHDGVSDFGVDFFPFKAADGRPAYVGCGRGTGGPTCSIMALLAPGPDGPVATERYEMLREGVQLGEAILFLERALQDKKISGDLAARVNRCLDERGEAFARRLPVGRFERDTTLLALAGEVAATMGER